MSNKSTDDHPIATTTRVPPADYTDETDEDDDEEYEEGTIATSTRVPR